MTAAQMMQKIGLEGIVGLYREKKILYFLVKVGKKGGKYMGKSKKPVFLQELHSNIIIAFKIKMNWFINTIPC